MSKQDKCRNTQLNRIVINKNNVEKRIYINELDDYLKDGWIKGTSNKRKTNLSKSLKGRSAWNKGNSFPNKINSGSFKKGCSPWNKDLTKENNEVLKNMSNTFKGRLGTNKGKKFSNEHKEKISKSLKGKKKKPLTKELLLIKLTKEYITKKKNNSFNKSKIEDEFYSNLSTTNKNKTIYRQYKDERYPFYCDFYIVEDDLFIELNAHWTHGGKPYDPQDLDCQRQLNEWQKKAKTSKFYENAIITWTIRDVEKQKIAKENNLNYKVIY